MPAIFGYRLHFLSRSAPCDPLPKAWQRHLPRCVATWPAIDEVADLVPRYRMAASVTPFIRCSRLKADSVMSMLLPGRRYVAAAPGVITT